MSERCQNPACGLSAPHGHDQPRRCVRAKSRRPLKRRLADRLQGWAYRLDPDRPRVVSHDAGWSITVAGGVELARISPGMIQTERGTRRL